MRLLQDEEKVKKNHRGRDKKCIRYCRATRSRAARPIIGWGFGVYAVTYGTGAALRQVVVEMNQIMKIILPFYTPCVIGFNAAKPSISLGCCVLPYAFFLICLIVLSITLAPSAGLPSPNAAIV